MVADEGTGADSWVSGTGREAGFAEPSQAVASGPRGATVLISAGWFLRRATSRSRDQCSRQRHGRRRSARIRSSAVSRSSSSRR